MTDRNEGIRRIDAGTTDAEGFIAPPVGLVDHALYFTSAPDVHAKTLQVLDGNRLEIPGAVIVWDETIGRRTGSKAVAGSWWATSGSVTMTLVFPHAVVAAVPDPGAAVGSAVVAAIASFSPSSPASYADGAIDIEGKTLGSVQRSRHGDVEIFTIRINANTDFAKAPQAVRDQHLRLVDRIDVATLPLGQVGTLANSLSQAIMSRVPAALGYA